MGAILSLPLSILFKFATPGLPFIDRMGLIFLICSVQVILMSAPTKTTFIAMAVSAAVAAGLTLLLDNVTGIMTLQHALYVGVFSAAALFVWLFHRGDQGQDSPKAIAVSRALFATTPLFNALAIGIVGILGALYLIFW